MNKLVFHAGGQPVYLDDLQTLQDQFIELIGSFIGLTTYNDLDRTVKEIAECNFYQRAHIGVGPNNEAQVKNGFFLNLKLESYNPTLFTAVVAQGYVYIGGEMLKYERTTLTLSDSDPEFFVIVKTLEEDLRTLDNGEQAYCMLRKYAVLSTERPETDEEYYSSHTIMSFIENLYYKLYWRDQRKNYDDGIITG